MIRTRRSSPMLTLQFFWHKSRVHTWVLSPAVVWLGAAVVLTLGLGTTTASIFLGREYWHHQRENRLLREALWNYQVRDNAFEAAYDLPHDPSGTLAAVDTSPAPDATAPTPPATDPGSSPGSLQPATTAGDPAAPASHTDERLLRVEGLAMATRGNILEINFGLRNSDPTGKTLVSGYLFATLAARDERGEPVHFATPPRVEMDPRSGSVRRPEGGESFALRRYRPTTLKLEVPEGLDVSKAAMVIVAVNPSGKQRILEHEAPLDLVVARRDAGRGGESSRTRERL